MSDFLGDLGGGAQLGGMLLQAVGSYYGVRSQQLGLRSAAMDLEFQGYIADLNARQAEREADAEILAGQQQAALVSLERGQEKASQRTSEAAAGVGGRSGAEVRASIEFAKQIEVHGINLNTIARASARRMQAVDQRNQEAMSRVSAGNLRRTSGTMSAWGTTLTSLLGSGSTLSQQWTQQKRREG